MKTTREDYERTMAEVSAWLGMTTEDLENFFKELSEIA